MPRDGVITEGSTSVVLPGGQTLALAVIGDPQGIPVIALHGTPATSMMYRIAERAAREAGIKLIAPDRHGYGHSPIEREPTLAGRAADLLALADQLDLARFAILGVSGGGPYAAALAADAGDRALALALVAPVGPLADAEAAGVHAARGHHGLFVDLPLNHPHILSGVAYASATAFRLAPHLSLKSLAWSLGGQDHDILVKPHVEAFMIAMTSEALASGTDGALADLGIFARPWNIDWPRISAPCHIWQGSEDLVVPAAATAWLAGRIGGAVLEELPGAGHFWVLDHIPTVMAGLRDMATGRLERGAG